MASTSYNRIPSSSTSTPTVWDVFLSFRGKDTRYTFTDHLYKALLRTGIRTYMDQSDLQSGEVISDSLIQAIQDSKTYIVVLSENYASSSWCLDELVQILDCYKTNQRLVIPVFYNIDPSVVRHQMGRFKQAFEKHQTRFDMDKVEKWRRALNEEVAHFSGYHVSRNRSQADIVDEVVDRVLLEINPTTLDVAKYPVGLDSRVKAITELLKSDTEGVIRIGIHGMGGVGKTTLAKAVYNQHYKRFQGSCFLANVREVSKTEQGLVCLQKQLISDVLKRNNINIGSVDQGIELIRARICSRKVLIVIDDVDDPKPLEVLEGSFASGSITIITTRNEDLLDSVEVQARYKVNELDADQSCQLFAQHAFGDCKITDEFTELSRDILKRAGGLPLALKVFGSNMLNKSEEEWRWFIDKLNRVPIDDIEKKLLISFDTLKLIDPMLQNIFLDIACFYIGQVYGRVIIIMETCYTFVHRNIDILKKRCLITINEFGILGMHDLLRDMGREIARNNSPDESEKHSRLWLSEDIDTVLKNHKGTEEIQGIISRDFEYENEVEGVTFMTESFKKMSKLRFLHLNNVNLSGSFEQAFKDLRWLRWVHCPLECLPSNFYPQKLVILELPHCKMRTMGERNMVFEKLKTLDMSNSRNLTTTPDFTRLPCLETLNLAACSGLEEVHTSIGILMRLVSLNLRYCSNLRSLPDSICSLRALEVLYISGCTRLEALPKKLGNIESLKDLDAWGLSVTKLPDSVGCLSNLVELCLRDNAKLETLPDSICNLRSLEILDISNCQKLEKLPDQLGMITSLVELNVKEAAMLKLLPNISQISKIKDLDLTGCGCLLSIAELPHNLKGIKAKNCRSIKILPDLSNAKQLMKLELRDCESMEKLLNLSHLKQLKRLDLANCKALTEIQGLEEVSSLEYLNLSDCGSMERLPNLSDLKKLEKLYLENCTGLTEIQGLEELICLRELNLRSCNSSLVTYTLTKPFFQILSGFGHQVRISIERAGFPDWISQLKNVRGSTMSLELQPNASHNFLAIIFCFNTYCYGAKYSIRNITSTSIWSDTLSNGRGYESLIVIVPSSVFQIREGDDKIELTLNKGDIHGIHLLYKTEILQ